MSKIFTYTVVLIIMMGGFIGCEDDSVLPPPPDQNPPLAPSNLEGEAISSTEIRLTWNDRSENEDGFEIHESVSDQNNLELLEVTDEDVISFTLTDKLPATTYYYEVRGFNEGGGAGESSNVISVTTLAGAPDSPSNLIAEAVSSSQVNLVWQDNSDNEDGFKIERRMESAQIWVEIGQTQEDVSSFQDEGLTPATAYIYRAMAHNETGDSDYSNEATATTDDPPADVPVAPDSLSAETVSSSQINLSWKDNSNNEENFDVERRPEAGGSWEVIQQVGADVTTFYDIELDANTTYYYRVRASNSAGDSDYSNVASGTTQEQASETPEAPSNLQAEAISVNQINISWQDNSDNEDGFKIERKTGAGGEWSEIQQTVPGDTTYQNQGLTPTTTYYYRVLAFNTVGNSDYSNEASATTQDPPEEIPDAPSGLQAEAVSSSQIDLSWDDNSDNEEGFKIERKTGADAWSEIQQVGSNVESYNNLGLEPATTYNYRVAAYNGIGDSGFSNEDSTTTEDEALQPPQLISPDDDVTINPESITFDWTDVDGAHEYQLQVSPEEDFSSAPIGLTNNISEARVDFQDMDWFGEGTYYWRAGARIAGEVWENAAWSDSRVFQFVRGLPAPELLFPEENITFGAVSITFDWTDVEGAAFYGLQISPDIDFGHTPIGLTDNNSEVTVDFQDLNWFGDGAYYWRAGAFEDGDEWSDASISVHRTFIFERAQYPEPGEERDFRLTDDMDITMVWIPSGEFMMGAQDEEQDAEDDEYPRHRVTLDYGFWMGKYEVTQEQWEAVMGENPSHDYGVGDDYPVYYVSWDDIQDFEEELDNAFRLPSESEWEYACRAGHDETRFHWGDDDNYEQLGNYAWYEGNSGEETHPVGQKGANDWGLKDMSGNVWEWCEDWYHDSYDGAPNDGSPWVAGGGQYRVMRGGSWGNVSSICRSANRNNGNLDYRSNVSGFRLVRDAD
ncbi:MAG: SUMF1/EgtB/PvdO family nonheme iron enzyme [Calditrichaeota bacterium]|nr:SUMF1/EgtB/PvdO family nonheme iron enzyme [Calditrichota bacterium]